MMKLTVTVPAESSGNVFSYLMARRGLVERQDSDGRLFEIEALVPLVNMFDYADELRSLTQGRASSTLEPHSYAPAPDELLRSFSKDDHFSRKSLSFGSLSQYVLLREQSWPAVLGRLEHGGNVELWPVDSRR